MNIESVREYCLSLPLVTEAFPFDERTLVFRILGKIFACVDLERPEWVTMKCNHPGPDSPQLFRSSEEAQETGADGASGNAGCEGIGRIIHFFCSLGNACFQDSSYLCTQKS